MAKRIMRIVVLAAVASLGMLAGAARANVISIDFNRLDAPDDARTASGTVTDVNGHTSLPGQTGLWNQLLSGTPGGGVNQPTCTSAYTITSLKDGSGTVTGVAFTFNTGNDKFMVFTGSHAEPLSTDLHRDAYYPPAGYKAVRWQFDHLQASTEYKLKFFGLQDTTGQRLFANFSATGLNTATGGTSLGHNYVDLVVTSTVNGQITGTVTNQVGQAAGTWSGIQIQGNSAVHPRQRSDQHRFWTCKHEFSEGRGNRSCPGFQRPHQLRSAGCME